MPSLVAHNLLDRGVWVVSILLWRVMEAIVDIRTRKRLRTGVRPHDKGSRIALVCLIVFGAVIGVLLPVKAPTTDVNSGRDILFWLGILLMYVGMAFRFYAIAVLGAFFTTTVATAPGQTVIESGPYRRIRHPSYTGLLITLLGFGLTLTNWLSLLVVMVCAFIGLGYRIWVEEQVLQEQLGQPYRAYMRRTKRLIPFVL